MSLSDIGDLNLVWKQNVYFPYVKKSLAFQNT